MTPYLIFSACFFVTLYIGVLLGVKIERQRNDKMNQSIFSLHRKYFTAHHHLGDN